MYATVSNKHELVQVSSDVIRCHCVDGKHWNAIYAVPISTALTWMYMKEKDTGRKAEVVLSGKQRHSEG